MKAYIVIFKISLLTQNLRVAAIRKQNKISILSKCSVCNFSKIVREKKISYITIIWYVICQNTVLFVILVKFEGYWHKYVSNSEWKLLLF